MNKIKKTDHFYLIDGSGYIFRAYYALPPLTRKSDGLPTGAVSGFCNMLFKLLEDSKSKDNEQKPTHFAVIFDSARKNFRNKIYSEYKNKIVPFLGEKVANNRNAYKYLEESISQFPNQKILLDKIKNVGFEKTSYINLFDGIVSIHIGFKI